MAGSLNRELIHRALQAVEEQLRRRRLRGHVYVIGGAAMALAYRSDRVTLDVDALIVEGHTAVTEAAWEAAESLGLPRNWLNEQAAVYMPMQPDKRAPTLFDTPHLVVTGASPRHMLAMKFRSARESDLEDIAVLLQELRITDIAEIVGIHDEVFPENPAPSRSEAKVRQFLEAREDG